MGAALFTIFSLNIGGDPGRIAAQVVTGVGFIGAGVIIHEGGAVRGLTTASTIWLAAALGIGAGSGYLLFSLIAALLALVALWGLPWFERRIGRLRMVRIYQVTTAADEARARPREGAVQSGSARRRTGIGGETRRRNDLRLDCPRPRRKGINIWLIRCWPIRRCWLMRICRQANSP